jgi:hypothetical protein
MVGGLRQVQTSEISCNCPFILPDIVVLAFLVAFFETDKCLKFHALSI